MPQGEIPAVTAAKPPIGRDRRHLGMKAAPFDYVRPGSIVEACAYLAADPDAVDVEEIVPLILDMLEAYLSKKRKSASKKLLQGIR